MHSRSPMWCYGSHKGKHKHHFYNACYVNHQWSSCLDSFGWCRLHGIRGWICCCDHSCWWLGKLRCRKDHCQHGSAVWAGSPGCKRFCWICSDAVSDGLSDNFLMSVSLLCDAISSLVFLSEKYVTLSFGIGEGFGKRVSVITA